MNSWVAEPCPLGPSLNLQRKRGLGAGGANATLPLNGLVLSEESS